MSYVLLIIGFIVLIKSASWLVDGSSSLARQFGIPSLVIGLTIVSLGTSAPELAVNVIAGIKGSSDLAVGNILGSNIANILLILGVAAMIYPLALKRNTIWKEIPFSLLAVLVLFFMANDISLNGDPIAVLSISDGLTLVSFLLIFLYYVYTIAKDNKEESVEIKKRSVRIAVLMIITGAFGLFFGGKWIVDGAIQLASQFGVSETLIGLTIVAVGTSLPELATAMAAAYKRQADILVGNVVGSNIFNIFFILGAVAIITPTSFKPQLNFDILIVLAATLFLFLSMFIGKKHKLERWQGVMFVGLYVAYLTVAVIRG